jgi:hypothetical protein
MRAFSITSPLNPKERHMLRQLDDRDGAFVPVHRMNELVACAALAHAGYARKHEVYPHHYQITPQGEYYLERLARAH